MGDDQFRNKDQHQLDDDEQVMSSDDSADSSYDLESCGNGKNPAIWESNGRRQGPKKNNGRKYFKRFSLRESDLIEEKVRSRAVIEAKKRSGKEHELTHAEIV